VWLLAGLGNPGDEYARTRHNVGFRVLDMLSARNRAQPGREKWGGVLAEATVAGQRALLCKPMEYMNLSGQAIGRVASFWKVAPAHVVVVHDELDLPFGRLKLGVGGGPGGHNGLRSIIAAIGADFARVRVGVGRPPAGRDAADYVLDNFSRAEEKALDEILSTAAEAAEAIVAKGVAFAMNRFNGKAGSAPAERDDNQESKNKGSN
jgi:PTH1 family peptidyl-tRNA hydrolase